MRSLLNLLRGFGGHPLHPPLTDASIGAYTTGTVLVVAGWLGFLNDRLPMVETGFLAIAVGLVFAAPTALTGFVDLLYIRRGTGMRRTVNLHWVVMIVATGGFLVAEALLQRGFDTGTVTTPALLVTMASFGLLAVGGYVGGTVVFEYGMRVRGTPEETGTAEALKPKWPPD